MLNHRRFFETMVRPVVFGGRWLAMTLGVTLGLAPGASGGTLDQVRSRGALSCGVSQGIAGFSLPDARNQWTGLDVDFCRALAAAIFGDATKVKYLPLSAKERFTALQMGEIDLLSRNTTWSLQRDAGLGLNFVGVIYYDGQGFLVRQKARVNSVRDLGGATICTQTGTTTELNAADYFRSLGLAYKLVVFEKNDEVVAAYEAGRCDAFSADQSGLYAARLKLRRPDDHVVLPDLISKEPLGPAVRQGDDQWTDVVRWVLMALFEAEELELSQSNVDQIKTETQSPRIKRFLGLDEDLGKSLGLRRDWAYQIVRQVGSYGDLFARHLGEGSPLHMARGYNALWTKGGLHYAIPFR